MDADFHIGRGAQSREIGYPHRKKASDPAAARAAVALESSSYAKVSHEQKEHRSALVAFERFARL
jgi:hypothetical protein